MIAVLGALLEENDVDTRLPTSHFKIPGEYTDMEIGRVGIYSSVSYLFISQLILCLHPTDYGADCHASPLPHVTVR